jgi:hypothetical protein
MNWLFLNKSWRGWRTYLVSTLDPELAQRDEKLLIRIKPLSQPNQKLEMYRLYALQAIIQYDSMNMIPRQTHGNTPFSKEK